MMRSHFTVRCAALLLSVCMLPGMFPGFAEDDDFVQLTVPIFFETAIPEEIDEINEAINAITRVEIGAEIVLVPLLSSNTDNSDVLRQAELELLEKDGLTFDLFNNVLGKSQEDMLLLNDLLALYGQDILSTLRAEPVFSDFSLEEPVYTLPSVSDYTQSFGITMRRDILEDLGIDPDSIESIYDLTQVFALVHEKYPDMSVVSSYLTNSSPVTFLIYTKSNPSLPIVLEDDQTQTLGNYYAGEEFKNLVYLFREWYLSGYMVTTMTYQSVYASELVRAGSLFSYFTNYKPSIEMETSQACGYEMVTIALSEPVLTKSSITGKYWAVSKDCANPDKAVQFISLLYTNSELVNLLAYGLEGVHYTINDDGTVSTRTEHDYYSMPWLLPNQYISYVRSGFSTDLWEETRLYNQSAAPALLLEFTLDTTDIAAEVEAVGDVIERYLALLTSGQIDPDVYLNKMLSEMEDAGMDEILSEAQRQYELFLIA